MKLKAPITASATLLAASLSLSTAALAEEATSAEESPVVMTAPKGSLVVMAHVDINLSKDSAFEPVSLAPDIWYGATEKFSVGLTHSGLASDGFWGGAGAGLCLTGDDKGCGNTLSNTGLQARYDLSSTMDGLAFEGGFIVRDFDPFVLGGKVGAVLAKDLGSVQLAVSPNLQFGLTERDLGNKELLNIPVSIMYGLSDTIVIGGQTGISLPFSDAGELWRLPVSIVGQALLSEKYYAFGAFSLVALAGGDSLPDAFDSRVLTLGFGAAL